MHSPDGQYSAFAGLRIPGWATHLRRALSHAPWTDHSQWEIICIGIASGQ